MASSILGTGISGLQAARRALDTTGHNISNAQTEGYSRQRVEQATREPGFRGFGYVGNGVDTTAVTRQYDDFLGSQQLSSASAYEEVETYRTFAAQVDNFVAADNTALTPALQSFFNSVQDVAADPTSTVTRQSMLSEADSLTSRFKTINGRLDELRGQIDTSISDNVNEINADAASIANLNQQIVAALGRGSGNPPNDLLDQRDLLVNKLAEKVDVKTVAQDDGSLNIVIGAGQSLVQGNQAAQLELQASAYDGAEKRITISSATGAVDITDRLTGGKLSGIIQFREETLDPAQNGLGRIATGLAQEFNRVHEAGYDLDGNTGVNFFDEPGIDVLAKSGSAGTVTATLNDANQLSTSDYRLDFDGANYNLMRLSDSNIVTNNTGVFSVDGLDIIGTGLAASDSFLIRPTRNAAAAINVAVSDGSQIAASGTDTATGTVGDNTNASALAALQDNGSLGNGALSFQDAYGSVVSEVGSRTRSAEVNSAAQKGLLDQTNEAREAVSGVNLDEEAANLIKFQQAYQASAQVISIASTLFDTLIGAVRR